MESTHIGSERWVRYPTKINRMNVRMGSPIRDRLLACKCHALNVFVMYLDEAIHRQ